MTTPFKIGMSALILLCSQLAEADIIGSASYGGTGCPDGTLTWKASQSRTSLTINLSEMETNTGDATGATLSRKACALTVPLEVPEGKFIESIQATYEGVASVAEEASVKLQTEHFLAGSHGVINKMTFEANEGSSFALVQNSKIQSACGQAVALRMNFSLLNQAASAQSALTSGIVDRVKYKINLKDCD